MIKTFALLLTTLAATTALADGALPSNTDDARADAAQRTAMTNRAASLRPFVLLDSEVISVTETESARRAAAQANARQAHDTYLSDVLRAGTVIKPPVIRVTDTDSARAAAAQANRAASLAGVYADYVRMQAEPKLELSSASKSGPASADVLPPQAVER